jgi:hypothetical protein
MYTRKWPSLVHVVLVCCQDYKTFYLPLVGFDRVIFMKKPLWRGLYLKEQVVDLHDVQPSLAGREWSGRYVICTALQMKGR